MGILSEELEPTTQTVTEEQTTSPSSDAVVTPAETEAQSDTANQSDDQETVPTTDTEQAPSSEPADEDSSNLEDLSNNEIIKRVFSNSNQLLTDAGGKMEVPKETRNLLAYFSDGTLLISNTHRYDGRVMSFEALIRQEGSKIKEPHYVSLGTIGAIYKEHAKKINTEGTTSALSDFNNQMQKDFVDVVSKAAELHVSDVHVVVSDQTTIMFRIDGTMQTMMEFDGQWGEAFVRSVFASADISDSNYAQNEFQAAQKLGETPLRGSKDLYLPSNILGIRLQFNPIAFGSQYLVMRLLYTNAEDSNKDQTKALQELGLTEYELERFFRMRAFPTGLCIIAGPTGSGKSTTLQQNMILMLKERNYEINLLTVEDPPEYPIHRAQQMPVTNANTEEEKDEAFTKALAAALRSDPDVLMVGEIRTLSAAELTFKGALSGHNVWSTIHANSAAGVLMRLQDMGIEEFKLQDASVMKGMISQRLFKKLCPHCRKNIGDHKDNPAYQRLINAYGETAVPVTYLRGDGCDKCHDKGVVGRAGAFEIILPDAAFLKLISSRQTQEAIDYWMNQLNGRTLREAAVEKMLQGIIGIDEIERWCGFLDEKEVY